MGICESKIPEMDLGRNRSIPIDVVNKIVKSVCKIIIPNKPKDFYGTGFFMKISDSEKYFLTNNHVINQDVLKRDIEIELHNKKRKKLNFNDRIIKYLPNPRDITMIEIKKTDEIYNDIEFLDYDLNYIRGYKNYEKEIIILIGYPKGGNAESASGIIENVYDFEFDHDISTEKGSSGSPIILYTKNVNSIKVIGIHKASVPGKKLNNGTFIGEIFNNKYSEIKNILDNNNYIIAEINIKQKNINRDIRIINSYEESCRNYCEHDKEYMNEEEIKKCEIEINDVLIPFNYFYKFKIQGKYIIKYSFNNFLTKTNHMFSDCSSLTNINLSNFNTKNVTNMSYMFYGCSSLTNLNLSNFNTINVTNMIGMFWGCSSLNEKWLTEFFSLNKRIIGAAKGYYEYEPEIRNYNQKIKIVLETTYQYKVRILIDPNKTITELIKFYFKIIKRPELFGDEDIIFLCDGSLLLYDSRDLVKNYIIKYKKYFVKDEIIILIDDIEEKIKKLISFFN